jgi:hypothetical protein
MSFNKNEELRKKYNEILDIVIDNIEDNTKLMIFKESYTDEDLDSIISKFCKDLESDNKFFKLFINRSSRLFGNKLSLKIIPSHSIKSLLDKNSYLWECVQLIYAIYRTNDEKYKKKVDEIIQSVEMNNLNSKPEVSDSEKPDFNNLLKSAELLQKNLMNNSDGMPDFNNLLKSVNLNNESNNNNDEDLSEDKKVKKNEADNLIMDIAGTLRDNIVNSSKNNGKVNPIENMIETSKLISEKYSDKIQSGNFSMNEMFESLGRMMDDIDKKTSEDTELQEIEIENDLNPNDIMKDLGINTNDFNPMDMISSLLNKKKENNELTPEQIKEMEEFYASINTEDLILNEDQKNSSNQNDSNLLSELNNTLLSKISDDKKEQLEQIASSLNSEVENI